MRTNLKHLIAACAGAGVIASAPLGCGDLIVPPEDLARQNAQARGGEAEGGVNALRAGGNVDCAGQDAGGAPTDLACTGLYAEWGIDEAGRPKHVVSPEAHPFDPGLHLWSDNAEKVRWVFVPRGQKIDNSNNNEWWFPPGFKVWKQFSIGGRVVETRFLWKRGEDDWVRMSYRWSPDGKSAVARPEGERDVDNTTYIIPNAPDCDACHAGRQDKVLGFEAVSLAQPESIYDGRSPALLGVNDLLRTPIAPEALVIPDNTAAPCDAPGTFKPGDGTLGGCAQRKALGWLHANCGTACHNPSNSSLAGVTGLHLRLEVAKGTPSLGALADLKTFKTAVCKPATTFRAVEPPVGNLWYRIYPGEGTPLEGRSLIALRDSRRNDPAVQMPPIGSQIPDLIGTRWVSKWIDSLPGGCPDADAGAGAGN